MNKIKLNSNHFLQKLEKKLQIIPVMGETLSTFPALLSLIIQYTKKDYPDFPLGSLIAIIIILGYSIYPADIIPDVILGLGQLDDIGVILACWKLVKSDVEDYRKWLNKQNFDGSDIEDV